MNENSFEAKRKQAIEDFLDGKTEDFDLYAQDPSNWAFLTAIIPGLVVRSAGGMCPFQSEGTLKDYPFYFRYRGGFATLKIGERNEEPPYFSGALWSASEAYGDEYGGALSGPEFVKLMCKLVRNLSKAPYWYQFNGKSADLKNFGGKTEIVTTDQAQTYGAWAFSEEEAWETVNSPSEFLLNQGWTREKAQELVDAQHLVPGATSKDSRKYPAVEPVFDVLI